MWFRKRKGHSKQICVDVLDIPRINKYLDDKKDAYIDQWNNIHPNLVIIRYWEDKNE